MNDSFKFRVVRGKNPFTPEGTVLHFALGDEAGFGKDDIIEQCTGVKDKNGNLIYEGDIVTIGDCSCQYKVCLGKHGIYVPVGYENAWIECYGWYLLLLIEPNRLSDTDDAIPFDVDSEYEIIS